MDEIEIARNIPWMRFHRRDPLGPSPAYLWAGRDFKGEDRGYYDLLKLVKHIKKELIMPKAKKMPVKAKKEMPTKGASKGKLAAMKADKTSLDKKKKSGK